MKSKGFTLIELLVSIAIIGILVSVIITFTSGARSRARDIKRMSDARAIITAINFYYSVNGNYPSASGAVAPNSGWANSSDSSWDTLLSKISTYIKDLPKDPLQDSNQNIWAATGYAYSYVNCGPNYMFVYRLENAKGPDNGAYCGSNFYRYGGINSDTNIKTLGN